MESNVKKKIWNWEDIVWIAKSLVNGGEEIILDFIIERKRISDLLASIKDGRYLEQKFRLQKCGINRIVYLIEGNIHENMEETIENYLISTHVNNGFFIQNTKSEEETIQYLCNLTKHFENNNEKQKI